MEIKPFGNQILVKPREKKQVIGQKPLCEYGDVLAIGDSVQSIKVGDVIGYTIWGVNSLEINDQKHYFIPEDSSFILGTLKLS